MTDTTTGRAKLAFRLEDRAGITVVAWPDGTCRPASIVEQELWHAMKAKMEQAERDRLYQVEITAGWKQIAMAAELERDEATRRADQVEAILGAEREMWVNANMALRAERDAQLRINSDWRSFIEDVMLNNEHNGKSPDELQKEICRQHDGLVAERDALRAALVALTWLKSVPH